MSSAMSMWRAGLCAGRFDWDEDGRHGDRPSRGRGCDIMMLPGLMDKLSSGRDARATNGALILLGELFPYTRLYRKKETSLRIAFAFLSTVLVVSSMACQLARPASALPRKPVMADAYLDMITGYCVYAKSIWHDADVGGYWGGGIKD